jgi:hypothetical protein
LAWLAVHTSKTAVGDLMRVAWRTVGAIVTRVVAEARAAHDPFDGLRRIGIDEISYKRGHRYLTVVVDHDTGRLVWAAPGHDKKTLACFFDVLGAHRCAGVRMVPPTATSPATGGLPPRSAGQRSGGPHSPLKGLRSAHADGPPGALGEE